MLKALKRWEINQQYKDMLEHLNRKGKFNASDPEVFDEVRHALTRTTFFLSVADPNGANGPTYHVVVDANGRRWLACFSDPEYQAVLQHRLGKYGEMGGVNRLIEILDIFDDLAGAVVDVGKNNLVFSRELLYRIRDGKAPAAEDAEFVLGVNADGSPDYAGFKV